MIGEMRRGYLSGMTLNEVATSFGLTYSKTQRLLKIEGCIRSHSQANRTLKLNEDFFSKIDTESKAYFLGFLFADGCVQVRRREKSVRLTLHSDDEYILESLKSELAYSGEIRDDRGYKYITVSSHKLVGDLIRLGCTPKKAHNLKFPKLPKKLIHHFIRGVFDGDGSIFEDKGKIRFTITGHIPFLKELSKYLPVPVTWIIDKRSKDHGTIRVNKQNELPAVRDYLYSNSTFFLKRKFKKWGGVS